MSINKKLIAAFILVVLLTIFVGLIGSIALRQMGGHVQAATYNAALFQTIVDLRIALQSLQHPQKQGSHDSGQHIAELLHQAQQYCAKKGGWPATVRAHVNSLATKGKQLQQTLKSGQPPQSQRLLQEMDTGTRQLLEQLQVYGHTLQRAARQGSGRWLLWLFLFMLFASAVILVVGVLVANRISRPFQQVLASSRKLVAGDFKTRLPEQGPHEWRALHHAFNLLAERLSQLSTSHQQRAQLQNSLQRLLLTADMSTRGDLTVRAEIADDAVGRVAETFNTLLHKLGILLKEIGRLGSRINASSGRLAQSAEQAMQQLRGHEQQLSQMMQGLPPNAAATVSELPELLSQLQVWVSSLKRQIQEADHLQPQIQADMSALEQAQQVLGSLQEKLTHIAAMSHSITRITGKTDLLALNAAIEASRATGTDGRGITAVAEQVRSLAEESQQAAQKVTGQLENFQQEFLRLAQVLQAQQQRGLLTAKSLAEHVVNLERLEQQAQQFCTRLEQTTQIYQAEQIQKREFLQKSSDLATALKKSLAAWENISQESLKVVTLTQELDQALQKIRI